MTDTQPDPTGELPKISAKHSLFVDNYFLKKFNGTQAYKETYPDASDHTARVNATRLLANTSISLHVQRRIEEMKMGQSEAETILADYARGDLGDFLDDMNIIDLKTAREKGITKLIKKFRQRTVTKIGKKEDDEDVEITDIEIELHDPQAAIDKILRVRGAYKDKVALQNPDGTALAVTVIEIIKTYEKPADE